MHRGKLKIKTYYKLTHTNNKSVILAEACSSTTQT